MTQQMFVSIDFPKKNATGAGPRVRSINGYEVPNWQLGPELKDYIRRLIKDGWTWTWSVSRKTLVFER